MFCGLNLSSAFPVHKALKLEQKNICTNTLGQKKMKT